MKKLILPIVMILGICVVLVMAEYNYQDMGMTKQSSGIYEIKQDVENGWNILPCFLPSSIAGDSDIKTENIKVIWIYIPTLKKYYQIYPTNQLSQLSSETGRQLDESQLLASSCWINTNKDGVIHYNTAEKYPEKRNLYAGWNFITITPDWFMKSVKDISDCKFTKFAGWQRQDWQVATAKQLSPSNQYLDDFQFLREKWESGHGVLVYAQSDCQLKESGTSGSNPPSLPNDEIKCIDSDGGLNYNVKGTVTRTGYDSMTDYCPTNDVPNTLVEYTCNSPTQTGVASNNYVCPNSCNNGACISVREEELIKILSDSYLGYTEDHTIFLSKDCDYILDFNDNYHKYKPTIITLYGLNFIFEVTNVTENDIKFSRNLCTKDQTFCDNVNDYVKVLINKKELTIALEEIRRVNFDNGLTLDIANLDNDPELCINKV